MDAATRPETELEAEAPSPWRRRLLLWVLPLALAMLALYLYGSAGRYVSTDNAYVQRDRVDVAPQVSGDVREVLVAENQPVVPGQPVLVLDDTLPRIAVAAAESRLETARAEIMGAKVSYREKTAEVAMARRAAMYADRDLVRQEELAAKKLTPLSTLDSARRTADLSNGGIDMLELQRAQTLARFGGSVDAPVDSYGTVRTALADLERARVDLGHTRIAAPQAGIASHLPKVGSRVDAGRPAFAIVSDHSVWVEANFKETDLEWVRPGQPVAIVVDTYPNHAWHGRVQSIAQATGAEFSLLPAQNASGNWVKVVQRIAVRIAIDAGAGDPPLRDGMSANVDIDTGKHTRFDRWLGRDR
ncbi:MAG TPA: HlyD family secretion protein [Steroidobacteraceae bacterium]|nr:HlyD family secretion protein [Steroidobacteraceae bacterium]